MKEIRSVLNLLSLAISLRSLAVDSDHGRDLLDLLLTSSDADPSLEIDDRNMKKTLHMI